MSKSPREACAVPVAQALERFCPRKLGRAGGPNVKRYLAAPKPLLGYMVACPGCGFTELHMHEKVGYVEHAGALVHVVLPFACMNCNGVLSVDGGILAVRYE